MKLPTLYKLSNRSKIEEWNIETEDSVIATDIIVTWGIQNGKKQEKRETIIEGKNIGKSNETSHREQAESEAKSKWEKQKDKGYYETIPTSRKIRPMLAKVYGDHKNKITYPCFVQPKLDGMRALSYFKDGKVGMVSRKGKEINTAEHIKENLKVFFKEYPDYIFDGELYVHGKNFQKIISAVKRDDANEESKGIEYHIYDCFSPKDLIFPFEERLKCLKWCFSRNGKYNYLKQVKTTTCKNEEEIFEAHQDFLKLGYEGSIIRNNAFYEIDKRSSNLLKLKEFQDEEFEIINFEGDKNNHIVFLCKIKDKEFKVKPEGTDEIRRNLLINGKKYIGKLLTVKYFELSEDGIPRFPIGRIRDYE